MIHPAVMEANRPSNRIPSRLFTGAASSMAFLTGAPVKVDYSPAKQLSQCRSKEGRNYSISCCQRRKDQSSQTNQQCQPSAPISRRNMLTKLLVPLVTALPLSQVAGVLASEKANSIEEEVAIQKFREVTGLQDLAFEYTNRFEFAQAEIIWTKLINLNDQNAAAFSNRGNCRTSQGKFKEAVEDFDRAIALSPEEPDPQLGKGVALEGIQDYRGALGAYKKANQLSMEKYKTADAVALNNMGNAHGALGEWEVAFLYYKKASDMDSHFVFALANEALAQFQLGNDDDGAVKTMRFLTRKYPQFGDMHAATAMALWDTGKRSQAEDEWFKAVQADARYEDISWVRNIRRWPPRLVRILENFRGLT